MNVFFLLYFFNLFVWISSSSLSTQIRSLLKSNVTIQHLCEDQFLVLQCSNPNEVIQIVRSMYGRTSSRLCHGNFNGKFFEKPCANIEQSKMQTKLRCHGKSSCQFLIDNHLFADPCGSNISKHFEIHYRCLDRDRICPQLFDDCYQSNDLKCIEKIHDELPCFCPSTLCQYENERVIGFIERTCPAEYIDGLHWPETLIEHNESHPCPSPCSGEIIRSCHTDQRWSDVNAEHCQCPLIHRSNQEEEEDEELSMQDDARSYVFQCNFWLIKMIWPKEESSSSSLSRSSMKFRENSFDCLSTLFERISTLGIEFANIQLDISSRGELIIPSRRFPSTNETEQIKVLFDQTSSQRKTMIIIDRSLNNSIVLFQQGQISSNVTVIFHRQLKDERYQCRAYQRENLSLTFESSNNFFACRFHCGNETHVICQCPYYPPLMHYVLHHDTKISNIDYQLLLIENQCEQTKNNSIDQLIDQFNGDPIDAKKILQFIDRSPSNNWTETIARIQSIGKKLISSNDEFAYQNENIEIKMQKNVDRYENYDRSVRLTLNSNEKFHSFVTILSHSNDSSIISPIVDLQLFPHRIIPIEITFQHQIESVRLKNESNIQIICVQWKETNDNDLHWSPDACRLLTRNDTHSICSCQTSTSYALLLKHLKFNVKSSNHRFILISKFSCVLSIGCLIITIFILILLRQRREINEDLTICRRIFHGNLFFCLIIVQSLYLFGIDRINQKIPCRIISILLDYFLLASYSWMFVDQLELFIAMKRTFHLDRIRLIAYTFYSYGLPLLILILTMIIPNLNLSRTAHVCWASLNSGLLWPLILPFLILIIGSFTFLILSFCSNFQRSQLRFSLRTISSLSILFGWTWLIAFIYHSTPTILIGSLFTFFNICHSFSLLIFLCSLEKSMCDAWQQCSIDRTSLYTKYQSFLTRSSQTTSNGTQINDKSLEHCSLPDNVSSSDYSSDLSSKQIFTPKSFDCANNEPPYLPSIPIHFLSTRLSTYHHHHPHPPHRRSVNNEITLVREQREQLLDRHLRTDDEHQYYEIH